MIIKNFPIRPKQAFKVYVQFSSVAERLVSWMVLVINKENNSTWLPVNRSAHTRISLSDPTLSSVKFQKLHLENLNSKKLHQRNINLLSERIHSTAPYGLGRSMG